MYSEFLVQLLLPIQEGKLMTESTHKQPHQSSRGFFHSSMLEDLKVNHSFPKLLENVEPVQLALQERQEEILTAIARKRSKASRALLEELAELSIALDDISEPQIALAEGVA